MTKMTEMTDWYKPSQLLDTAIKTAISTIIGENADPRLVGAAQSDEDFFNYSQEFGANEDFKGSGAARPEIWIDYVSDVGDGWNSTYSVAYTLARETLDIAGEKLPRGELLIFGGDGVYPTANSEDYEKKLVEPYRMAFDASREGGAQGSNDLKKNPHIFALPGNHDWYDSLVAFQKLFCTSVFNNRLFAGGWRTRQKRSYFALKLPQKWWLLGIDLQLSHSIDVPQLQYFESIAYKKMEEGDKVILCVPEPYWVKAIKYQDHKEAYDKLVEKEESIAKLEDILEKKGIQTKLYVAGDLHHYRRFESHEDGQIQKITAGGGGAFLHPTHDFDYEKNKRREKKGDTRTFDLKKNYPEPAVSSSLDWTNLYGFIFRSPKFGILTAILYPLLALLIGGRIEGKTEFYWRAALEATVDRFIEEPLALIVIVLMIMGLIFFTDSNSTKYRRRAGFIHAFTHLTAIFFLGWWAYRVSEWINANFGELINTTFSRLFNAIFGSWLVMISGVDPGTLRNLIWFILVWIICGIGGYIIGSFIMGVYLFVSLRIFGRHDNEAFSALKIEDYKNFLRMHIDASGNLTIYPIKIEKVGRTWDAVKNNGNRYYKPNPELNPELIEDKPIKI